MALIDDFLPLHQFSERHFRDVAAGPDQVMQAAAAYQPDSDRFFTAMIGLRELPMRAAAVLTGRTAKLPPVFGMHNFTRLGERPGRELVFGLVGQFWKPDFGLASISDGEAFLAFGEPGFVKLALGFSASVLPDGRTRLVTETRVFCPDAASRRRFTPYWYLIRPVSGLIRGRILRSIQRASEKAKPVSSAA